MKYMSSSPKVINHDDTSMKKQLEQEFTGKMRGLEVPFWHVPCQFPESIDNFGDISEFHVASRTDAVNDKYEMIDNRRFACKGFPTIISFNHIC